MSCEGFGKAFVNVRVGVMGLILEIFDKYCSTGFRGLCVGTFGGVIMPSVPNSTLILPPGPPLAQ